MSSTEISRARTHLALVTRWRGPEHPDTLRARIGLVAAKITAARVQLDELKRELDELEAAS